MSKINFMLIRIEIKGFINHVSLFGPGCLTCRVHMLSETMAV